MSAHVAILCPAATADHCFERGTCSGHANTGFWPALHAETPCFGQLRRVTWRCVRRDVGAIASRRAAELYGLNVLDEGIQVQRSHQDPDRIVLVLRECVS